MATTAINDGLYRMNRAASDLSSALGMIGPSRRAFYFADAYGFDKTDRSELDAIVRMIECAQDRLDALVDKHEVTN